MAFVWGGNTGEKLTPKEVERKRIAAALMQRAAGDTSPVASPFAGINRALQGYISGRDEKRAGAAETAGLAGADERMAPWLSGLGGGGMTASTSGGSPGGTWTPDAPAPSLTDVPGASGGLSFGNAAPAMPQEGAGGLGFGAGPMTPQQMIIAGAEARGLDPIDVATAISYETGGTFDPVKRGPTTQWGQHQGLIQFGQPQAKQYGADFSNPETAMNSQLDPETGAVWNYLDKTGVQPGMGLDNIYSAINAGAPGRMNASDANNGGAPGTVADKVAGMGDHRQKAAAFLGGTWTPSEGGSNPVTVSTSGGAPQGGGNDIASLLALSADPWVQEKYGPVIDALVGQQTRRDDATWQQQLAQSDPVYQAQLAELTAPKPVDPFANTKMVGDSLIGADGQGGFAPVYTAPADPGYVQLTPAEVAAKGLPPGSYQRGADGKISEIGGGGVTVNNAAPGMPPVDDALRKKLMEGEGTTWSNYLAAGATSAGMTQDMELLKQVIEMAPQGPISGRLAQAFPGVSDAAGVFQSVVKRVAPSLRVEGSGSQSDIEYNGFLQSLPSLSNNPEANRAIATFLEAKAQINMQRATAIQEYQDGKVDAPTARAKIAEIDRKSILSPQLKGLLGGLDGGAAVNDDAEYLKSLGLE